MREESGDADDDEDNFVVSQGSTAEERGALSSSAKEEVPSKHYREVDATVVLPSSKEYVVPSSMRNFSSDDYAILSEAP